MGNANDSAWINFKITYVHFRLRQGYAGPAR